MAVGRCLWRRCAHALRHVREPAPHHKLLIDRLERVARGEIKRLAVFVPPGSAKSTYGCGGNTQDERCSNAEGRNTDRPSALPHVLRGSAPRKTGPSAYNDWTGTQR